MTRRIAFAVSTALSVVTLNAQTPDRSTGADLIVFNGRILTQNLAQPEASALAVKRGRIFFSWQRCRDLNQHRLLGGDTRRRAMR
jgi:hypothetical protein